ncbi:unnamed protein product, partial [Clonostachys rosea]
MAESQPESQAAAVDETQLSNSDTYIPPSVSRDALLSGASSRHFSPVPVSLQPSTPGDP